MWWAVSPCLSGFPEQPMFHGGRGGRAGSVTNRDRAVKAVREPSSGNGDSPALPVPLSVGADLGVKRPPSVVRYQWASSPTFSPWATAS